MQQEEEQKYNQRELHYFKQLNIDPEKPLPYCLTDEDFNMRHYKEVEEQQLEHVDPYLAGFLTVSTNLLNNAYSLNLENKRPSITEAEFVKTWLPRFYGEHKSQFASEDDEVTSVMNVWVHAIAGNSYTPVEVTRFGKIIYRIPPLIQPLTVMKKENRGISVYELANEAIARVSQYPTKNVMDKEYSRAMDRIFKDQNGRNIDFTTTYNIKPLFVMDEIFTYYGYDTILTPELMSIKSDVMGGQTNNGNQSSTNVSSHGTSQPEQPMGYDEDDDPFA